MCTLLQYEDKTWEQLYPKGKLFRISFDSTLKKFRLFCFNERDFNDLVESFSVTNPASFYMKQYGYNVPSKISQINNFGYFACGLIFDVLKIIKLKYGTLAYVAMSEGCKKYIQEYLRPLKSIIEKNGEFEIANVSEDSGRNEDLKKEGKNPYLFRDYQKNAIHDLIFKGYGRGMIQLPTASGKSFFISNYCYNFHKNINKDYNILLLVPNKQLVFQMYNDFKDYGYDMSLVTKFTAGLKKEEKYNPKAKIIIANRQFIFTNKQFLPKIDVLFCDEIHQVQSGETANFVENLECKLKAGCSGSIPRDKLGKWKLIGMFGNVIYSEKITDLQKRGFISKMKLYSIQVKDMVVENDRNYLFHIYPKRKYSPDENGYSEIPFNAAHDAEHAYYEEHYKDLYKPVLEKISEFEENTLFLFDKILFGQRLFEMAKDIFKDRKIHYIDGSVPVKDRLDITSEMEKSGNNVLFAEVATFVVGINIKRLTNLVFISSSKSFPRILQGIGRTLRLHNTKTEARIFDVSFNYKYSQRHFKERLEIYKENYNKVPDAILKITLN